MNAPKLRFKEFSGFWNHEKMSNLYSFKVTNSYSRERLNYENGLVKNIHYGDIHTKFNTSFDITKERVPFINEDVVINKISKDNYCQEGDMVFADASEDLNDVGKAIEIVFLNKEPILAGLHTLLARPDQKRFFVGFGGYLFKSNQVRRQIQKEAQGTKVLSISASRISQIDLYFPSLPEQQKIASFFTAVDQKLTALKKKKELLEQYKKGVMQKIFSQKLRFKDENGKPFPDWEEKSFKELVKLQRGSSPRPIVKYITHQNNGVNWIKIGDVDIETSTIKYTAQKITPEGAKKSRYVEKGEIILSNSMSYGIPIVLEISGYIHDGWFVIRNYEKHFEKDFLKQILGSELIQKQYYNLAAGGVVNNISSELVYSVKIYLPSIKEQQKIADFLSALDKKIEAVQKQIEKTEQWKKGLLQQMFV